MKSWIRRLAFSLLFVLPFLNIGCFFHSSIVKVESSNSPDSSGSPTLPQNPPPSTVPIVLVSKVYPNSGGDLLQFVPFPNKSLGLFEQSDVPCTGAEAAGMHSCIHAGELLVAELPSEYTSCGNIVAEDALDAFNWICKKKNVGQDKIFIFSTGFKNGKGLATIIDFSNLVFKKNRLFVKQSGNTIAESESQEWWSSATGRNPIVPLPDSAGSTAFELENTSFPQGTILVAPTSKTSVGYNINGDRLAIVTSESAVITFQNSIGNNCEVYGGELDYPNYFYGLCSGAQKFDWIEGNFNTSSTNAQSPMGSISLGTGTKHFIIRNFRVNYGAEGDEVFLTTAENVSIYNMKIQNSGGTGIALGAFNGSRFIYVDGFEGSTPRVLDYWPFIFLDSGTSGHILTNVKVSNSQADGVWMSSSDTVFSNLLGFNVRFTIRNEGVRNTIHAATAIKNSSVGIVFGGGSTTILNQALFIHNYTSLNVNNTNSNTLSQLGFFSTASYDPAISLSDTSNNKFTNNIVIHDSTSANRCDVSGTNTNPGMIDYTCGNQGSSNATWTYYPEYFNLDFIVGTSSTDSKNKTVGLTSPMAFTAISDWIDFSNWFRMWGEGMTPANPRCVTGEQCQLWDFRFNSVSSPFKNDSGNGSTLNSSFVAGAACPTPVGGNVVLTDLNSVSSNTFLVNAIEIPSDAQGDNDGLCESNEQCIYMPNFGVYQGEGDYKSSGTCVFQDGIVSGVSMYAYPINGQ